ncbi:Plasmodium exported protein (hyp15), unknown function [Plasmodium sp. gorilla clade G2]|uniref:Plasmodium exported protein (hyp15), unknown function n=1 Tax=Plasmodium sp. gorilla clade G2 TaxID=880535 RepID=UPI000D2095D5|nr:Plasmodium exported protein (hyp15), unknown function [Plasmodium sp. gorilla clade G2]SOV18528.1 Plasmodium exported protein (hyp15), unknown function [Plasmodium sp. gorilla clade G2]
MNFCSIIFLFIVILSVLRAEKENIHKENLYTHDNKNTSRVKCATKEPVYNYSSKNDNIYEKFQIYDKEKEKNHLDKGKSDEQYSENVLYHENIEDIIELVKIEECGYYENNMMKECNVRSSSNPMFKRTSRMTKFKNKLYKMIFKKNKFWKVISGMITVLGQSAIICEIILVIGYIVLCTCPSILSTVFILFNACLGILGIITLLIILVIIMVWLLVTWLWSHKDMYYETHEE